MLTIFTHSVALTVGCVVHSLMTQLNVQLTAFSVRFFGGLFTRNNNKITRKRTQSQRAPSPSASRHDRLVWATSVGPKGSRAGAHYRSIGAPLHCPPPRTLLVPEAGSERHRSPAKQSLHNGNKQNNYYGKTVL